MKNPKRFAMVCLLFLFLIGRETGLIELHWYRSKIATDQSAHMRRAGNNFGSDSYILVELTLEQETIFKKSYQTPRVGSKSRPIKIEAVLEPPTYTGNLIAPLWKSFQMSYSIDYQTTKGLWDQSLGGNIRGTIKAKIWGFCTRAKSKKIMIEKIQEQLDAYLVPIRKR